MPSEPTLENPHYACPVCLSTDDPDYWEKHLTLARRAEIGRLVEQLTDACRVVPMVGKGEDLLTELRARVEELTDE